MSVDVQMFRRTGLSEAVVYRVGVARVDGSSPAPRLQVVPCLPVPPAEQPACPVLEHKKPEDIMRLSLADPWSRSRSV